MIMFRAAALALSLFASPALASGYYHAEPAVKPAGDKLIVRDVMWRCGDTGCSAAKNHSRPAIICAALVKEVGALRSFSAGGEVLAPEELQKCNARAD